MPTKPPAWSYSRVKAFETCPRQYYHLKVAKTYKDEGSAATAYGSEFHEAAEFYLRDGTPLPDRFNYARAVLDTIGAMKGDKHYEYEMGLKEDLTPCKIDDETVWWKGIADVLIVNGSEARVLDYKTSKSAKYADKGQLELMAMAVFRHFPQVTKVKAGLVFVVCNAFVRDTYEVESAPQLWEKWLGKYRGLEAAYKNDVWNPRPSGLCFKHCLVECCEHNGRN